MSIAGSTTMRRTADFIPVTVVICLGLVLSGVTFFVMQAYFLREEKAQFRRDVTYYSTAFQNDVDRHVSSLAAIQAFVFASHEVNRWDFSAFAHQILPESSGFRAILWAPNVANSNRETFEAALQHDGLYGLQIRELRSNGLLATAAKRPKYVPVAYVEPFEGNEGLVGVDLLPDPTYAPLINEAQASGQVVASAPLSRTLIAGTKAPFVMLAFPLTPKGQLHAPLPKRLSGFALGILQLGNVLADTFNDHAPLEAAIVFHPPHSLEIFDSKHNGKHVGLGEWLGTSKLHKIVPFTVAKQPYLLALRNVSYDGTSIHTYVSAGAAFLVIAITSLLTQTLLVTVLQKRAVELAVIDRTAQLRQANAAMTEEIEQRRQVEIDLKISKENAESANRSKSTFLSTMSHELRTPLNAIIGFSGVLTHGLLVADERAIDYILEINSSGRQLLGLINDILEISQMDAEDVRSGELVLIPEIIDAAISAIRSNADSSRVLLRDDSSESLPFVRVDAKRLQRALHHLISNSIKFTEGRGEVSISASHEANGLRLEVCDNGVGMPPDALAKLSGAFSQFDSSLARKHEGMGLGLTYVRKLAEYHGATFEISSIVGIGTRVSIIFPHYRIVKASEVA